MKALFFLIVVTIISCATTNYRSSSEEYANSIASEDNASSSSEEDVSSSSSESSECEIRYKYTIWIGDNVDEVHSVNLKSDCGIVFLDAMRQASEKSDTFEFDYTAHPSFGAFVTKIAGAINDDEA